MHIRLTGKGDIAGQIYRQMVAAIVNGRLRPGERVPATRELAKELRVARNTVAVAYERLEAEGLLTGRVGAGSFVTTEALHSTGGTRAPAGALEARAIWQRLSRFSFGGRPMPAGARRAATPYDFSVGTPDATFFPYTTWRRLLSGEFRKPSAALAAYGEPAGIASLREAIAHHLALSRGVLADADDVIVTSGAQQAFDLIGRVLITPGAVVAVEDPGYPMAGLAFQSCGADVRPVPVDEEGLVVDRIPNAARIVYVTPSHQFPRGSVMSLRRRAALLAWAERREGVIIEDDYDSEFRFGARPLDPLQCLDRRGRVIYVGTFSKVLLPSLRVGFLIAPSSLQPALRAARRLAGWHSEIATQSALAKLIAGGLFARHTRKVSREYADRHARVVAGLEKHCSGWLRTIPSSAGLHVTAELQVRAELAKVVAAASVRGVSVRPVRDFAMQRTGRDGLVLGYGAIPSFRIEEGLKRLNAAFEDAISSR